MFWALFYFVALVPYFLSPWWRYIAATTGLLLIGRQLTREPLLKFLGLAIPRREFLGIALTCLATGTFALYVIPAIAYAGGWTRVPDGLPLRKFITICSALNEEIVFRSVVLGLLTAWLQSVLKASVLSAAIFSLGHLLIYRILDAHWLAPTTLVTLFFFGLAANQLYAWRGHIGYSYALHVGWNIVRFRAGYLSLNGETLHGGASFDLIEGSWPVCAVAFGFWAVTGLVAYSQLMQRVPQAVGSESAPPEMAEVG
jgi:hypothetical protein